MISRSVSERLSNFRETLEVRNIDRYYTPYKTSFTDFAVYYRQGKLAIENVSQELILKAFIKTNVTKPDTEEAKSTLSVIEI